MSECSYLSNLTLSKNSQVNFPRPGQKGLEGVENILLGE